ncbi:MAG: prepilin-type N-terminal cleavage/methylation domain-containing protein, partial [Deltaproteobacteria bacterium]|nr:prepilin-type N-terminal cleavage/methylation domain-containing protein [Deltaproteobacteria bacterium]
KKHGFALVELIVVISILAIMVCIAIPGYSRWLPGHKLKSAARQLFSSMHLAKMTAIRNNGETAVVFNRLGNNHYQVVDGGPDGDYDTGGDNVIIKTININDYGAGVGFGIGGAETGAGGSSTSAITFSGNPKRVVFDGRGMANVSGYAHLENQNQTRSYAIGALASGVVRFRKWNGANWE